MNDFVYDKEKILPRSFYQKDTALVARELLGKIIVNLSGGITAAGRIVETEAYLRDDPSCHAFRGMTPRNRVMFGPPGHAYIYFTYGMHYCFNVVTNVAGVGEAVLLRALEPLEGIDLMRERRGRDKITDLCSGPGKLVQAMGIGRELYGHDLTCEPLLILDGITPADKDVEVTTRVGIKVGVDLPLRFYIKNNRHVSKK